MSQEHESRPNVIWILGDQHRGQALGCMGDPNLHTPNMDRLAAEGLSFPGAVSGFPLCCPYRGSMLTGRYPHLVVPGHQLRLPPEQPTLASVFREAGYSTAYFGKWHLDGFEERYGRAAFHIIPPERRGGFDRWLGYENNNSQWDCWVHGGDGQDAFHYRLPGYETDALTDLFIGYLQERAQEREDLPGSAEGQPASRKPFFAVLSVQPPHDPYVAPAEWMARHTPGEITLRPNVPPVQRIQDEARRDLAGYYAMIENLDWNLGRIVSALDETGLLQETHILFFSDHGDMHGSHGQFRKTTPWEEAIRVPFIIAGHIPRYTHRSGRSTALINHVDVAPTTLGLCNIPVPEWMQGTDYSGLRLQGKEAVNLPDSAYLQLVVPTGHSDSVDRPWRGVVTREGWKYVTLEGQPMMLFNLEEDPYELANQAYNPSFRVQRRRLQDQLAGWISTTGDTFQLPEILILSNYAKHLIEPPSMHRIVSTWWPLAISWILMSAEPSALAAIVARLQDPSIHLAAYGSVAFPLIGIIQAPVLTLLSLSTAMSKDWESFLKGRRLMYYIGGGLTLLLMLVVFTPIYYWVVEVLIGAPPVVLEPARTAMIIGLPWTFAVAYRRFHQGVMIRFEHSRAVTVGTILRFAADATVLIAALKVGTLAGASVASLMMVVGVVTEAVYVGLRVRPILSGDLRVAPPVIPPVSMWAMFTFFIPLGLTPLLNQLIRPIGSASLSRLPNPLVTLAVWPVISSFSFLIVTPGSALSEVVIAMLDRPRSRDNLRKFMYIVMAVQFVVFAVVAFTPLSYLWFSEVSGLDPGLAHLASNAFILLLPASLLTPLNSWFSGAILHSRRSRSITEAMGIYLGVYTVCLLLGGVVFPVSGIYIAVGSSMLASIAQNFFLWYRSRPAMTMLDAEDAAYTASLEPNG